MKSTSCSPPHPSRLCILRKHEIFETKDVLTVVADLSGVEPNALDVRVADEVLTLQARTQHLAPGNPVSQEYELLRIFRQFELPDLVDPDRISAELKHGVLALHCRRRNRPSRGRSRCG
jgi:HSP20 family protein